jgi:hypothetical protein
LKKHKKPTLEEELAALSAGGQDPACLRSALGSSRSLVAGRAAKLIKERALDGFGSDLKAAFLRFLDDAVKSDPNCHAKQAALEALDYTEWQHEEPFVAAARYVQLEPVWGGKADTAVGVRSRAVVALARIDYPDLDLIAGELLGDPEPPVRKAALDALAHRGARSGAGLVLFKLSAGDDDPMVTLAALTALMSLAPDRGLQVVGAQLGNDQTRELAALALGESRHDGALSLLIDSLSACVQSSERAFLLRGIALNRSDRALDAMLSVITDGAAADAKAAVLALGARRFDPGVAAKVRAAAKKTRLDLEAVLAEAFPD